MAVVSTQGSTELAGGFVLSPERYDPRRSIKAAMGSRTLGDLVQVCRSTVKPVRDCVQPYLVLDTGDAREGFVTKSCETVLSLGSNKKPLLAGDVIISRLRPYLRQVAFVDSALQSCGDWQLVCSTEFFVLRSIDNQSIAYLVPFLLSAAIQSALAASQEGGHHPRFSEMALLSLPVPRTIIEKRKATSLAIEKAAVMLRESEGVIRDAIIAAECELSD